MHIQRYRVKQGAVPPKDGCVIGNRKAIPLSEDGTITLVADWRNVPQDDFESRDYDLDFFLVLDEEYCQPYSVFYSYLDYDVIDEENCSHYVMGVIKKYNQTMDKVEWLERVR